ncbi:serine/threonine-protein kinase [Nonomuraea diastatica]|uniref:non-specific serine/threonine protein kinase n=1 Tax=Nonomuraea diastatica TaxID=1848329 RepID=A0A4R4VUX1_9ACTN|nr:serine/threonine-protein kinase [Nonomuraea diastatica]TDD09141.1 serine/threonine protein kinase [Nonomuraea diastatica]
MLPVENAPGYRVLDEAGRGGFAVVYRAHQERLDRIVALKVLSVDRVDQRTMRRFQRELQLTGRLTGHPNVVTVFDTGVTRSGKPYIAMDFFEHGSLRDKVRREGPLSVQDTLRAGVKLAGALAAVHEAGVLHGDIKPQNILISRYGEPAIADFGVARVVDNAEVSATSQAFTPLHAAPEVLTGAPHSASTDIYSLGSTLYHLLAGRPAFHNATDPSIAPLMYRVLSVDPPPLNRADVPPPVFETILRAMSKHPEARYASARELARTLQEVQGELGLPVTDLVGQDPGPGPGMSTVSYPRHDPHATGPAGPVNPAATGGPAPRGPGVPAGSPRPATNLVIGVGIAVIAAGGTALAVHLSLQQSPPPRTTTQPPASQQGTGEPEPIDERDVAALAPRALKVTADQGALVKLRWALPSGARRYPVVLQRSPVKEGEQRITALAQGATSTRVAGLDPDTGYCFVVGVPLRISESSTVAWSKPMCIRGAVARSTE